MHGHLSTILKQTGLYQLLIFYEKQRLIPKDSVSIPGAMNCSTYTHTCQGSAPMQGRQQGPV